MRLFGWEEEWEGGGDFGGIQVFSHYFGVFSFLLENK